MLYPATRAARVDDNVRHALKALRVGLDFGRNFLAGLRASIRMHISHSLRTPSTQERKSAAQGKVVKIAHIKEFIMGISLFALLRLAARFWTRVTQKIFKAR